MKWHIGQRVVCVVAGWKVFHPQQIAGGTPTVGSIYTIRGFNIPSAEWPIDGAFGLYLEEIVNPKLRHVGGRWAEMSFDEMGFRPVKDTDISVFRAMLNPAPETETV